MKCSNLKNSIILFLVFASINTRGQVDDNIFYCHENPFFYFIVTPDNTLVFNNNKEVLLLDRHNIQSDKMNTTQFIQGVSQVNENSFWFNYLSYGLKVKIQNNSIKIVDSLNYNKAVRNIFKQKRSVNIVSDNIYISKSLQKISQITFHSQNMQPKILAEIEFSTILENKTSPINLYFVAQDTLFLNFGNKTLLYSLKNQKTKYVERENTDYFYFVKDNYNQNLFLIENKKNMTRLYKKINDKMYYFNEYEGNIECIFNNEIYFIEQRGNDICLCKKEIIPSKEHDAKLFSIEQVIVK